MMFLFSLWIWMYDLLVWIGVCLLYAADGTSACYRTLKERPSRSVSSRVQSTHMLPMPTLPPPPLIDAEPAPSPEERIMDYAWSELEKPEYGVSFLYDEVQKLVLLRQRIWQEKSETK